MADRGLVAKSQQLRVPPSDELLNEALAGAALFVPSVEVVLTPEEVAEALAHGF